MAWIKPSKKDMVVTFSYSLPLSCFLQKEGESGALHSAKQA